jgi:predicted DNA-binding transcriptional regulator AlpA
MADKKRWLTEVDLYELLERTVSRPTIKDWRYKGVGPPYTKLGGRVVYRSEDVDAWLDKQSRLSRAS